MIESVFCIKNEGWKEHLTIGKEYFGELKYGFYINYIEVETDKGHKVPIVTEYFVSKKYINPKKYDRFTNVTEKLDLKDMFEDSSYVVIKDKKD
jgi:hypothetical protein